MTNIISEKINDKQRVKLTKDIAKLLKIKYGITNVPRTLIVNFGRHGWTIVLDEFYQKFYLLP